MVGVNRNGLIYFGILINFNLILHHKALCTADISSESSSIKFENGRYDGILIGFDGDQIEAKDCKYSLEELNVLLSHFSEKLFHATNGTASIGQVNVLLPYNWTHIDCGFHNATFISEALTSDSYSKSHIQITKNHPMTYEDTLPWTKQYRPCGQPSDSILIPLPFLHEDSPHLSDPIKGQVLLHEWTKFRYGAFDEIGYENDASFSPCYTNDYQAQLTCCTSFSSVPKVAANESACSIDFLFKYQADLKEALEQGSSSVMSSPYLESVFNFCTNTTHNPWAPTKQNLYCRRKSVAQVVFSHSDFQGSSGPTLKQTEPPPPPTINVIKHQRIRDSAYAFVIQDSTEMRDHFALQHVKQAIAQFLEMLQDGTEVQLFLFSGNNVTLVISDKLRSDFERRRILNGIPNRNSKFAGAITPPLTPSQSSSLSPVIENLIQNLSIYQSFSWNVFLFPSTSPDPPNDMLDSINLFKNTSHSISIFTFENSDTRVPSSSEQWLSWYKIPNTKNIVPLPFCVLPQPGPRAPCTLQTSSFITDQLIGILNDQQFSPRFLQNPLAGQQIAIKNSAGQRVTFQMKGYGDPNVEVKRAYIFLSIPENTFTTPEQNVRLTSPLGVTCTSSILLGYNSVIKFNSDCVPREGGGGDWSLEILNTISPGGSRLFLTSWVELSSEISGTPNYDRRLTITPSLGLPDPSTGMDPNGNFTFIFVALQNSQGYPVLNAQVSVSVFYPFLFSATVDTPPKQIILRDDGGSSSSGDADQTENDGIYSAYLSGFSKERSAFHMIQVQVSTDDNSKILQSIESPRAILLNEKFTGKCCGKRIRPLATEPVWARQILFQSLHLGFKTSEGWSRTAFQPGPIGSIKVAAETDTSITVQFDAVSAGDGSGISVSSYQVCCVASNGTVSESDIIPPGESSCKPNLLSCDAYQSPGHLQKCSANKKTLVDNWVSKDHLGSVDRLKCTLRAVSNSEFGEVSQKYFDVNVAAIVNRMLGIMETKQNCEKFSLSDKCLPIWIFWVMIGCLGLLVVIIVIFIVCFCRQKGSNKGNKKVKNNEDEEIRMERRTRTRTRSPTPERRENILAVHYTPPPHQPPPPQATTTIVPHHHQEHANNNVNVHRQRSRERDEDAKVVKELFVNHAYIQDGDGEIKIIADNGQILRKPKMENVERESNNIPSSSPQQMILTPPRDNFNMQIYKPTPFAKPVNRSSRPPHKSRGDREKRERVRPEIIHPNPMLRSDSTYGGNHIDDTSGPMSPPLSPPRRYPPSQHQPLETTISTSPTRNSGGGDPGVVYATITRRFKPPVPNVKQVTFDPHYMVPHNSQMATTTAPVPYRQSTVITSKDPPMPLSSPRFSLPPPQMPSYPTTTMSDSDTSTDYGHVQQSRSRRVPPRFTKPPPYPAGSQLVNNNKNIFGGGVPPRSPKAQHASVVAPPVPPPRFDRTSIKNQNHHGAPAIQNYKQEMQAISTDDDDDSDEWDDGDHVNYDFDNTTGVSYA